MIDAATKKKKTTIINGFVFVVITIFELLLFLKSLARIFVEVISAKIGLPKEIHFAMKINSGGSVEIKLPNVEKFELLNGVEIIASNCSNDSSNVLSTV